MRISDWSSDVCSSDLKLFADSDIGVVAAETAREWAEQHELAEDAAAMRLTDQMDLEHLYGKEPKGRKGYSGHIGRASCRESVCQYVKISWVAGSLKKKKQMRSEMYTAQH